jgi:L-aminopeptidase/D-esterase-like protein
LEPGKTFYRKQAVFLTGGDVFRYDEATGIRRYLLEHKLAGAREGEMPEIVGANIYDLSFAKHVESVNYSDLGYRACDSASSGPVEQGSVGAGLGATVGKLRGSRFCWKGGLGTSAVKAFGRVTVGAIIVTNAVGNIFNPETGKTIAGTRKDERKDAPFLEMDSMVSSYLRAPKRQKRKTRATTIGLVVTNLALDHEQTYKVAQMAHDGLARAIRPVHMTTDGDLIFAISTGEIEADFEHDYLAVDVVGAAAAQQVTRAVLSAVRNAKPLGGIPGLMK